MNERNGGHLNIAKTWTLERAEDTASVENDRKTRK